MVLDHLLQPGRSADKMHVGFDLQHKTASNFLPSPERMSASSSAPRPTAARKTGRCYKDVFVIYKFCKGVLVMWVVIFSSYE
jgi:hypothetical protein